MEAAFLRMVGNIVEDESEGFALEVRTIGIVHKVKVHLRLFEDNSLDTEPFATDTQRHHTDEFFAYLRNLSETVYKTSAIGCKVIVEMLTGSKVVEFPIKQHTLRIGRNILVWEVHLQIGLKGTIVNPT